MEKDGYSLPVTWGDNWMIKLKISTIGKHIKYNESLICVGCSSVYARLVLAKSYEFAAIVGGVFAIDSRLLLVARK